MAAKLFVLLLALVVTATMGIAEHLVVPRDPDREDGTCVTSTGRLSIANASAALYVASPRVLAIADAREQISNGPRTLEIGGVLYPIYYGPRASPGSVTAATRLEEIAKLKTFRTAYPQLVAGLAVNHRARLTTIEGFAALHEQTGRVIEPAMSTDNSDETFGAQRLSIKSFALREATHEDLGSTPLALSNWQLVKRCGLTADALLLTHSLFVEDYGDVARFNDPDAPHKFVPNVVGFFCVQFETQQLVPIEIRMVDTKLVYTPFDTNDEWTLAKMALESASVCYHQMQHMVETHAVTVPLRVEMLRTMDASHPVRALVQRHVFADFALEMQAAVLLLNVSTPLDKTFGWGATGATRFLYAQTQRGVSVTRKRFHEDLRRRGVAHVQSHKYALYGGMYWTAMSGFVGAFLDVYYPTDESVTLDSELQSWARACQTIPHVVDFPTSFASKHALAELLTHLVFTSTVRHHGMNGAPTWHGMNAPFSPAALWAPLPTEKGKKLDVLAYSVPATALPLALALAANFIRPVPDSENMFSAYTSEPFASEPRLEPAIKAFDAALHHIDAMIVAREADAKWPYYVLRPKNLAHYSWI